MVEKNVHPRLREIVTLDTIDVDEAIQRLADVTSNYVPCYPGTSERDSAWSGTDKANGGISQIQSDPGALYVRNPSTGLWQRFVLEREEDRGRAKLSWPGGGEVTSDTVAVTFTKAFTTVPMVFFMVHHSFTPYLMTLPTLTGFSMACDDNPGPSTATFRWIDWIAF